MSWIIFLNSPDIFRVSLKLVNMELSDLQMIWSTVYHNDILLRYKPGPHNNPGSRSSVYVIDTLIYLVITIVITHIILCAR